MNFTVTEKLLIVLALHGFFFLFLASPLSLFFLGITCLGLYFSEKRVPAEPYTVAVPTLWGRPQKKVILPRWIFAFSYFPILEDIIQIDTTKQVETIEIRNVRTKALEAANNRQSGGSVTAIIGVTVEPDISGLKPLLDYIKAGLKSGIMNNLRNIVSGTFRQEGAKYTWEQLSFSKSELSVKLVAAMTGRQPEYKVKRDAEGRPVRNTNPDNPEIYEKERAGPSEELQEDDYQLFIQDMAVNGFTDIRGLGIRIRFLNVADIQTEGDLGKDAERLAREQQQRRAEEADFNTEIALAQKYIAAAENNGGMTMERALELVRINRGRASEQVVRSSGSPLVDAATLFRPQTPKPPEGGTTA